MSTQNVSHSTLIDPLHKYRRAIEWLGQAREVIADPKRWTQHCAARNQDGDKVSWDDASAVCWCASAAVCYVLEANYALNGVESMHMNNALCVAAKQIAGTERSYVYANDTTDHPTVLRIFDRAIEILKERP